MTKRAKAKKTSRKATQATKVSAKNGSRIPKAGGAIVGGCVCGDAPEAHGRDPKYPGSTSCSVEGCECIAYEADPQDSELSDE